MPEGVQDGQQKRPDPAFGTQRTVYRTSPPAPTGEKLMTRRFSVYLCSKTPRDHCCDAESGYPALRPLPASRSVPCGVGAGSAGRTDSLPRQPL